jgi:hypothetical protein
MTPFFIVTAVKTSNLTSNLLISQNVLWPLEMYSLKMIIAYYPTDVTVIFIILITKYVVSLTTNSGWLTRCMLAGCITGHEQGSSLFPVYCHSLSNGAVGIVSGNGLKGPEF